MPECTGHRSATWSTKRIPWVLVLVGRSICPPGPSCRVGDWRGSGRRMGVAVAGGFRNAGASLPAITPFPVTAHR